MAVKLQDICKVTGLSSATVSRVLNNSPLVKEETRKKVQAVMDELDYRPLPFARALAGSRSGTIGLISPYVGSGFFTDIMVGVDLAAAKRKVHVMMSFAHGHGDEKKLLDRFIKERHVDAIVLINLDLPPTAIEMMKKVKIPLVSVDTPAIKHGIMSVSMDNRKGAYAMMSHLVEHGHRDFVIFAGPKNCYDSRERLAGCKKAAADFGISLPKSKIFNGSFILESGREMTKSYLKSGASLPDVIFALNDITAFGVMEVLREEGIRVPEDVAVVGFDNFEAAPLVGLTTVGVPLFDMGCKAAEMAIDALDRELDEKYIVLPPELIIRETCGCSR